MDNCQAIHALITGVAVAFNQPVPAGEDLTIRHSQLAEALDGATPDEVQATYTAIITNYPKDFPPTVPQIGAMWRRLRGDAPPGAANAGAYAPYAPERALPAGRVSTEIPASYTLTKQWHEAGLGQVVCKCLATPERLGCMMCKRTPCECKRPARLNQSGKFWECASGVCGFDMSMDAMRAAIAAKKGRMGQHTQERPKIAPRPASAPESASLPVAAPQLSDVDLVARLVEATGFEHPRPDVALRFAKFLLSAVPDVSLWTQQIARGQWQRFQEATP